MAAVEQGAWGVRWRTITAALALAAVLAPARRAAAEDAPRKQEIVFAELPTRTLGDAPFDLVAKSSSGLKVLFEVVSGPAVLDAGKLRLTGEPGLVIVRATQPGDARFLAAVPSERAFAVARPPARPSFSVQPRGVQAEAGAVILLSAEVEGEPMPSLQWRKDGAPLEGAVARTLAISPATPGDSGRYDLVASNASGSAASAAAEVRVSRRHQSIAFQGSTAIVAGQPVTLRASASSGLQVRYEVVSGSAFLSGNVLTAQPGTVSVRASQEGDATFEPAASAVQNFTASAGPAVGPRSP